MSTDEIDQLIKRLGPDVACERVPGGLLITTWDGEALTQPVKLHMTIRQLADQVRRNAEGGAGGAPPPSRSGTANETQSVDRVPHPVRG